MDLEEMKRLQAEARKEEALKEERNQAFIIGWIGGGFLLSAGMDSMTAGFLVALIISAIYAYGFHGKK